MPDDPSAILSGIRELIAGRAAMAARMDWDDPDAVAGFNALTDKLAARVPSLLTAAEAVLKLHQPVTTNGGWLEGREWQECVQCGPNNGQENVYAVPGKGESFWPCPTVQAITAALTGQETGDA